MIGGKAHDSQFWFVIHNVLKIRNAAVFNPKDVFQPLFYRYQNRAQHTSTPHITITSETENPLYGNNLDALPHLQPTAPLRQVSQD